MNVGADKSEPLTAIQTNLGAIFVSLELSRSSWLITSLSPGGGEKMSKHSVPGGDFAGLMERFAQLQEKARRRTGQSFRIIVVQEAGLDGFWIHRALQNEGIEPLAGRARERACGRARPGGRLGSDRDADPLRPQRSHPFGRAGGADRRQHQGVWFHEPDPVREAGGRVAGSACTSSFSRSHDVLWVAIDSGSK